MPKSNTRTQASTAAYVAEGVAALRESGLRITKPRLAVLECLAGSQQALAPRDLLERVQSKRSLPNIDLATVYRILEALVELDLVHRVGNQGGFIACEHRGCSAGMHVIAHCVACDNTQEVDLPEALMHQLTQHMRKTFHFQPDSHFFQMEGTCAPCTAKAATGKKTPAK